MSKPFRVWDSITLQQSAELAVQLKAKIEELCEANQCLPQDLPDSLISSSQLYVLVVSYEAAYSKLLNLDLLKTGIFSTNYHHNLH
jgi:hypothetical protein